MRSQRLMKNSLVVCLLLTLSFGSMASDGDRITQLEKEVQELKTRLSTLESPLNKAVIQKTEQRWLRNQLWMLLLVAIGILPDWYYRRKTGLR